MGGGDVSASILTAAVRALSAPGNPPAKRRVATGALLAAAATLTVAPLAAAASLPASRTAAVSEGDTVPRVKTPLSSGIVPPAPVMLMSVVPNPVAPPVSDVASSLRLVKRNTRYWPVPGGSNGTDFHSSVVPAPRRP